MTRRLTLAAAFTATLLAGAGLAAPAQAASDNASRWYLAIGDSITAGLQPGTGPDFDGGYTGQVLDHVQESAPKTHLRNLSCEKGETSTQMISGGNCTYEEGSQLAQALVFLRAHSETTELVTITIGANDVTPCLAGPPAQLQACVGQRLAAYAANLSRILGEIRTAAPGARIVVGNYHNPYIVHPTLGPTTALFQKALSGVITQVATAYGADVADAATAFGSYDGDGTPSLAQAQGTICATTWMCSLGNIHPNDAGYALYAQAFVTALES